MTSDSCSLSIQDELLALLKHIKHQQLCLVINIFLKQKQDINFVIPSLSISSKRPFSNNKRTKVTLEKPTQKLYDIFNMINIYTLISVSL